MFHLHRDYTERRGQTGLFYIRAFIGSKKQAGEYFLITDCQFTGYIFSIGIQHKDTSVFLSTLLVRSKDEGIVRLKLLKSNIKKWSHTVHHRVSVCNSKAVRKECRWRYDLVGGAWLQLVPLREWMKLVLRAGKWKRVNVLSSLLTSCWEHSESF